MRQQLVTQKHIARLSLSQKPLAEAIVFVRNSQHWIVVQRKKIDDSAEDRRNREDNRQRNSGNLLFRDLPERESRIDVHARGPDIQQLVIVEDIHAELKQKDDDDETGKRQ